MVRVHGSPEIGWFEFNVPCQHKYGYIRDEWVSKNDAYEHE